MKNCITFLIIMQILIMMSISVFADRLPSQVPENQVFGIDTLIDVTGPVSEESSMEWTLDDQDRTREYAYAVDGAKDTTNQLQITDSAIISAVNNLEDNDYSWYIDGNDFYLEKLFVDAWNINRLIPGSSKTWGQLLEEMDDTDYYIRDSFTDSGSIHNTMLNPTEEIMVLTWADSLRNNGGKLSLNKNIDFDSQDKGKGLSNLEVEKVLTYASTEGNHLTGAEVWTLDVAGSYEKTANSIRCVFASSNNNWFPAFCNVVKAKSELVNINSAQVSTRGEARSVAKTGEIPSMLNYQVAVSPDSNSGSGFADGTVKTLLGGSIMEAHANNLEPSATNDWKDTASVSGGIKSFQKTFAYESGITGPGDEDNEMVSTTSEESIKGIINVEIDIQCQSLPWVVSGNLYSKSGKGNTELQDVPAGTYEFFYNENPMGEKTINAKNLEITFKVDGC